VVSAVVVVGWQWYVMGEGEMLAEKRAENKAKRAALAAKGQSRSHASSGLREAAAKR